MKTTTLPLKHSMNRSPFRLALLLIPLAFACFALSPQARATCQDACLPNNNTVQGDEALSSLTSGFENTAIGFHALFSNTFGSFNTAIGGFALFGNTSGNNNTATGVGALSANTTGSENTATGGGALAANTTGGDNTANGESALVGNTVGNDNTAIGHFALEFNTAGIENTASGSGTLLHNVTGNGNTAMGFRALYSNKTGSNNTVIGIDALTHNSSGNNNIAIGYSAGRACRGRESNNIDIGDVGLTGESNAIRLGSQGTQTATYIAGISGATVPTGIPVIVDTTGHLGTTTSSARYKDNVRPIDRASEAVLALQPVTFRYKKELDPKGIQQFGLVAEDVEKVNPDLVARDEQGKPYTVRYEAVNAMLLNEFLKEHGKVEQLEKQVAALTAGLQKVSAQLELSKTASQTVLNTR